MKLTNIDYVTCLITLGAMAIAIIFSAIKVARILWELAIYRVLAMFFSLADLHNGEKLKEIIKAFAGAFIVIIVNTMLLKFFMVFSAWLSSQSIDGFSKSVMLVSVAIAVIDGPNLCKKLIGVDAGIRSAAATVGAVYAAGKIAHSAGKGAVKIGKGVGEFGLDVASKDAAIGGFAAGAGVEGAKAMRSAKSGINTPKDQKNDVRSKSKEESSRTKAADKSDKSQENTNDAIGRKVAADTPGRMRSDPSYSSDNIEAYKDAVRSLPQGESKTDAQITDMAQDAYIHTHGDSLIDEAAEIRDEAAANGTDMTEKDALHLHLRESTRTVRRSPLTEPIRVQLRGQRTRSTTCSNLRRHRDAQLTVQGLQITAGSQITQESIRTARSSEICLRYRRIQPQQQRCMDAAMIRLCPVLPKRLTLIRGI